MSESTPSFRESLSRPWGLDLVWWMVPAALAGIGFGLLPLRSWDYWWHITMGRLFDLWGAIPAANHFLYTMPPEAPSFIQPWLAQWLLFGSHAIGTVYAALVLRNLIAVAVVVWLTRMAVRRANATVAGSAATMLGLFFLLGLVELRPHLFAVPLFMLALATIDGIERGAWGVWWAPVVFGALGCVWANVHGSFPLAVILPGLAAVGVVLTQITGGSDDEGTRPDSAGIWLAAVLAAGVGTLVNPRTTGVWGYVYDIGTNPEIQQTVSEWWATGLWAPHGLGALFWLTLVAVAGASFVRWHKTGAWEATDIVIGLAFVAMAALQRRSLLWWGLVLPFVAARPFGWAWQHFRQRSEVEEPKHSDGDSRLATTLAVGLAVVAIAVQPCWQWRVYASAATGLHDVRRRAPLMGVVPSELPVEATHVLRQSGRPRVFHAQKYAGYIMFRLTDERPAQRVFVDHRIELPTAAIWEEFDETSAGNEWRRTFKKYAIRAALLNTSSQLGLARALDRSEDWRVSYRRGDHVLFVPAEWQENA